MGASARAFILSVGFILQARIIQNAPPARKRTSGVTGGAVLGPPSGVGGACGRRWCVWRRGASGFRRSRLLRKRMLRLASRGFGNRQIAFAPCRFGVHALSLRPRPSFPETGRTSTGIGRVRPFRALVPVIGARARSAAGRLACVCGADAARCCRLAPPRPRIRRAMRPSAASVRLAGPRARSAQPLHAPHIHNRKVFVRRVKDNAPYHGRADCPQSAETRRRNAAGG